MNHTQALIALQQTGDRLAEENPSGRWTIILGGAVAAMIVADLPGTRVTHDCDVLVSEPAGGWGGPAGRREARGRIPRVARRLAQS